MCIYDGKVASERSSSPPHWNEAKGVDIPLPTFRSEESTFMESIVCWTEHEIPSTVGVGNECERLLANITWLCMSSLRRSKIASPMIALIWSRRGGDNASWTVLSFHFLWVRRINCYCFLWGCYSPKCDSNGRFGAQFGAVMLVIQRPFVPGS